MGTRNNACSELTRFWLQARHSCLVDEAVAIPVPGGYSDIDFIAVRSDLVPFHLPDGTTIGPRLIVETKDEHDFDPKGREYGKGLKNDVSLMGNLPFIPLKTNGVKFIMLREEHYQLARDRFGTNDFDRQFVVHALDPSIRAQLGPTLAQRWRIHWVTIPEVLRDLLPWYGVHPHPAMLRQSLVGDLIHLLVGFCYLSLPNTPNANQP